MSRCDSRAVLACTAFFIFIHAVSAATVVNTVSPAEVNLAGVLADGIVRSLASISNSSETGNVYIVQQSIRGLQTLLNGAGYTVNVIEPLNQSGDAQLSFDSDVFRHLAEHSSPHSIVCLYVHLRLSQITRPEAFVAALVASKPSLIVFAEPPATYCSVFVECDVIPTYSATATQWSDLFLQQGYVVMPNETIQLRNDLLFERTILPPQASVLAMSVLVLTPLSALSHTTYQSTVSEGPVTVLTEAGLEYDGTMNAAVQLLEDERTEFRRVIDKSLAVMRGSIHSEHSVEMPSSLAKSVRMCATVDDVMVALTDGSDAGKATLRHIVLTSLHAFTVMRQADSNGDMFRECDCELFHALMLAMSRELFLSTEAEAEVLMESMNAIAYQSQVCGWESLAWVMNPLRLNVTTPVGLVQLLAVSSPVHEPWRDESDQINSLPLPPEWLWSTELTPYTTRWFMAMIDRVLKGGLTSDGFYNGMRELLFQLAEANSFGASGNPITQSLFGVYYIVPYVIPEIEGRIRHQFSNSAEQLLTNSAAISSVIRDHRSAQRTRPQPHQSAALKSIIVVCGRWTPFHSTYRVLAAYVEALKARYHVTLYFEEAPHFTAERALVAGFVETRFVQDDMTEEWFKNELEWLYSKQFDVAFFPEFGAKSLDLQLAAARIGTVQVASYGMSSSTHSEHIDYFLGGHDTEYWSYNDKLLGWQGENPQQRYSERLITIPGMGVVFDTQLEPVTIDMKHVPAQSYITSDTLIINCPWPAPKTNTRELHVVARILQQFFHRQVAALSVGSIFKRVLLRFFINFVSTEKLALAAAKSNIERVLKAGNNAVYAEFIEIEVYPTLTPQDFTALSSRGHIALDAHPFGGCLTVLDTLNAGVPVLTRPGDAWKNRISSAMLITLGLGELVSYSVDEYIDKAVLLLLSHEHWWAVKERLIDINFAPIIDKSDVGWYPAVMQDVFAARMLRNRMAEYGDVPSNTTVTTLDECIRTTTVLVQRVVQAELLAVRVDKVVRLVCVEWLHPLTVSQRNVYGGPLRPGHAIDYS